MWYYSQSGQQDGPVTQEELSMMLRNHQVGMDTPVWREGMEDWRPINQVPELMASGVPSAVPGGPVPYAMPQQTNGAAVASLVLGLVSFVPGLLALSGIPAVICGHIARKEIRENAGRQAGDGMALTGLITGYLAILLTAALVVAVVVAITMIPTIAPPTPPLHAPGSPVSAPVTPGSGTSPAPVPTPGSGGAVPSTP